MTGREDYALLDAQLEQLLELPPPAQQARLSELDRSEPELAEVLRKLLQITAEVETRELRRTGEQMALIAESGPIPEIPGYRITGEIGRGGMATVYAGDREVAGVRRAVAIKLLRAGLQSPIDRARFVNEQGILARLRHPHIATLLDVGVIGTQPYMVLERIDGAPIDQRLGGPAGANGACADRGLVAGRGCCPRQPGAQPPPSAYTSIALMRSHSRCTVRSVTPSTSATSWHSMPPKIRHSAIRASRGSRWAMSDST